ncbi:hypothetical protein Tco_0762024 [Tanacetum coccineum]
MSLRNSHSRKFLIKFLVLNGQRPLTLDFNTFCSLTGLSYNNGKYVDHPTPEVVKEELGKIAINPSYLDKTSVLKNSFPVAWRILFTFMIQILGGNYSSIEQVSSIQQLLAYSLITGTEVDIGEIIYMSPPPLAAKLKKRKSQTVSSTLPKSQGPEASRALFKKNKRPKSKNPPTKTMVTPPKPTKGYEQSHSVSLGTVPSPQDLKRDIQLASTGLPYTLDESTRKSKPLHESTATHPKDSGGNKQPLDRDITSTTPDEGTLKPCRILKGKTSSEVDPDTKPLQIQTFVDIQAFLLSEDELEKENDEEEVLAAGDDMDEDPQDDLEVRTPSLGPSQPDPSQVQESASD